MIPEPGPEESADIGIDAEPAVRRQLYIQEATIGRVSRCHKFHLTTVAPRHNLSAEKRRKLRSIINMLSELRVTEGITREEAEKITTFQKLINEAAGLRRNQSIDPEQLQLLEAEFAKLSTTMSYSVWASRGYSLALVLVMAGFAITALPGMLAIMAPYMANAAIGSQIAFALSVGAGTLTQFAAISSMSNDVGFGANLLAYASPRFSVRFSRQDGTISENKLFSIQGAKLTGYGPKCAITCLVWGALTASSNALLMVPGLTSGDSVAWKNVFAAGWAFPGSLLVFTAALVIFKSDSWQDITEGFKNIHGYFKDLYKNSANHFLKRLGAFIGETLIGTVYLAYVVAVVLACIMLTMGFTGALAEVVLKLLNAEAGDMARILLAYGIGLGGALPLTLIFIAKILKLTTMVFDGTLKGLLANKERLYTIITIVGIAAIAIPASLISPGTAVPATSQFMMYVFNYSLNGLTQSILKLVLVSVSCVTNGSFMYSLWKGVERSVQKAIVNYRSWFGNANTENAEIRRLIDTGSGNARHSNIVSKIAGTKAGIAAIIATGAAMISIGINASNIDTTAEKALYVFNDVLEQMVMVVAPVTIVVLGVSFLLWLMVVIMTDVLGACIRKPALSNRRGGSVIEQSGSDATSPEIARAIMP